MTMSVSFPTRMTHYRLKRNPEVISDLVGIIRISHLQRTSSTVGWMGGRWEQLYEARLNKSSRALSVSPFGQGHMAPCFDRNQGQRQINCEEHNCSRLVARIGPPPLCISMKMIQGFGNPNFCYYRWSIGFDSVSNMIYPTQKSATTGLLVGLHVFRWLFTADRTSCLMLKKA